MTFLELFECSLFDQITIVAINKSHEMKEVEKIPFLEPINGDLIKKYAGIKVDFVSQGADRQEMRVLIDFKKLVRKGIVSGDFMKAGECNVV